jgi:hypothetical protein
MSMKPIRLPEGGRASLFFPFEGDWDKTRDEAMYGASRSNILRHWNQLPEYLRKDHGFQFLMDTYFPVADDTMQMQRQRIEDRQRQGDALRNFFGSRSNPVDLLARRGLPHASVDDVRAILGDPEAEAMVEAIKALPQHNACVDFGVPFGGTSVVSTSTSSRTVAGVKARSNQAVRLWGFDVGFDGTTSTNPPGIVEIQQNTFAANAPGTNSNSVTGQVIDFGRPETVQATAAKAWTTEPTAITTVEVFFIPSYMGSGIVFTPLTKPFVLAGATGPSGGSMRVTQSSGGGSPNVAGTLKCEE